MPNCSKIERPSRIVLLQEKRNRRPCAPAPAETKTWHGIDRAILSWLQRPEALGPKPTSLFTKRSDAWSIRCHCLMPVIVYSDCSDPTPRSTPCLARDTRVRSPLLMLAAATREQDSLTGLLRRSDVSWPLRIWPLADSAVSGTLELIDMSSEETHRHRICANIHAHNAISQDRG